MASLNIVRADSRAGKKLRRRLARRGEGILDERVVEGARRLVEAVRRGGDRALLKAVRRHDGASVETVAELRLEVSAATAGEGELPAGFEGALERAIAAVERYHKKQLHPGYRVEEKSPKTGGIELVERRSPLHRVGIYVPGGRASYPSTAVMTVVPARLAGVEEIAVATPLAGWERNAALRFALERLGVGEVWGMGGAHAVAALAYGTETIPRVDKIVGPGNAWVTAAKRLVSGDVAIDHLAGPSELVIVAAGDADAALVAADLLAQAEHDPQAMAILVTDRRRLAKEVAKEVDRQLPGLATAEVAGAAIKGHGAAVVVADLEEALAWVEELAPEHLQLMGAGAEELAERVTTAAAIFVGASTPTVFGDYLAGPTHVLPTAGTARFASALGVEDFIRRSHVVRFDATAASRSAAAAAVLAEVEGLPAHAASALRRLRETG